MNLPNKQQAVIDFARQHNNEITTKQAVQLLDGFYYTNAAHYVSDILKRMVNAGKLTRTKQGHYRLSLVNNEVSELAIKNQTQLF